MTFQEAVRYINDFAQDHYIVDPAIYAVDEENDEWEVTIEYLHPEYGYTIHVNQ